MRETKYRFWDTFNGCMVYDKGDLSNFFKLYQAALDGGNNPKLMQFLGLKDKKVVYESDIIELGPETYELHYSGGDKVIVKWDDSQTGFIPFQDGHSDYDGIMYYKVVGNIYKNPELMEVAK